MVVYLTKLPFKKLTNYIGYCSIIIYNNTIFGAFREITVVFFYDKVYSKVMKSNLKGDLNRIYE